MIKYSRVAHIASASACRDLRAEVQQHEARQEAARCGICYASEKNTSLLPCMHRCGALHLRFCTVLASVCACVCSKAVLSAVRVPTACMLELHPETTCR